MNRINASKVKIVISNIVRDIFIVKWVAFSLTFAFSSRCFDCFSSQINSFCRSFFGGRLLRFCCGLFEAEEVVFTGCTPLDLFEAVRFAFLFVLDLAISQILLRTQNITSAFSTEQGLLHTHTQQRTERAHLIRNVPPKHPSFSITQFTNSLFTN